MLSVSGGVQSKHEPIFFPWKREENGGGGGFVECLKIYRYCVCVFPLTPHFPCQKPKQFSGWLRLVLCMKVLF